METTGHQNNPWFAISKGEVAEESGETWFGSLAWSGSWRITVEQDTLGQGAGDGRVQSV